MKFASLSLVCLLSFSALSMAQAASLDDLKTALAGLKGQGSLHGSYEIKSVRTIMEKNVVKSTNTASATALVEDDASGLQIRWDRALLARVEEEVKPAKTAKKWDSPTDAVEAGSGVQIAHSINYAPKLLHLIAMGQLTQDKADTFQGKPAHLLELHLAEQEVEMEKVNVKENTYTAKIWIGADGIPLGVSLVREIKASAMVFLTLEVTQRQDLSFALMANRLVVLRREESGLNKALGTDTITKSNYAFTPKL